MNWNNTARQLPAPRPFPWHIVEYLAIALLMVNLSTGWSAAAEPAKPQFQAEDPAVYLAFFRFHRNLADLVEQRGSSNSGKKQTLQNSAAQLHHVSAAEYISLTASVRSVMSSLDALDDEAQNYLTRKKSAKEPPDPNKLREFAIRQNQLAIQGFNDLHHSLSPTSWDGLYRYINQEFRNQIHTSPAKAQE